MAYGVQITNPSGGLVFSSSGFGLNFVGKATLHSTVSTSTTALGHLVYRISSPSRPLVFTKLTPGHFYTTSVAVHIGGDIYEITVFATTAVEGTSTSGSSADDYPPMLSSAELYCFARPTTLGASHGMAVYDEFGNLAWDVSRKLLLLRELPDFPGATTSAATALAAPAIMGDPRVLRLASYGGPPLWRHFLYNPAWSLTADGAAIGRTGVRNAFNGIEDAPGNAFNLYATDALVINSAEFD